MGILRCRRQIVCLEVHVKDLEVYEANRGAGG